MIKFLIEIKKEECVILMLDILSSYIVLSLKNILNLKLRK